MSPLRYLFTVLLLVLLPFQAMGNVYANTAAPALSACEPVLALAYYEDDHPGRGTCQAVMRMAAVALAPPVVPVTLAFKPSSCAAIADPALHPASHIPKGPQRPPCTRR